jgi:uncharacterized protein
MRGFIALSLAVVLIWRGTSARASVQTGPSSALPRGSAVQASVAVRGFTSTTAITYTTGNRTVLGIVTRRGEHFSLRWSHMLGHGSWTLAAPRHKGLLTGYSSDAGGGGAFYAFVYTPTTVRSGVKDVRSGIISGDRGIKQTANGFVLRRRDNSHIGSVVYRTDTRYMWTNGQYVPGPALDFPDYATAKAPRPNAIIHASTGAVSLLKLQIASTDAQRETGLMYVTSLDPDAGMVFVWQSPVQEGFWMENTYIPLSIAWIDASFKIVDIQEMAALDATNIHYPRAPYLYAIEANKGYFSTHDIKIGDTVQLHLTTQSSRWHTNVRYATVIRRLSRD